MRVIPLDGSGDTYTLNPYAGDSEAYIKEVPVQVVPDAP